MGRRIKKISALVVVASILATGWQVNDKAYAVEKKEDSLSSIGENGWIETNGLSQDELFISMDADGNVTLIPLNDVESICEEELKAMDNIQYEVVVDVEGQSNVVTTVETQEEADEHVEEIQKIIDEQPTVEAIVEEINENPDITLEVESDVEGALKVDTATPYARYSAPTTVNTEQDPVINPITEDVTVTVNEVVQEVKNGVVIISGYLEFKNEDGSISYMHGNYAPDAAYLGTKGDTYIFKQSGTIGYVPKSKAYIVEYDKFVQEKKIVSNYKVTNGKLYHNITTDNKSVKATIFVGYQQSYMEANATYYSYDGIYFYKDYKTMVTDYKNNTYANSINAKTPYYNYYQYLSQRTKTNFTAEQIDQYLLAKLGKNTTSVLVGTGKDFISNQNKYGVNAALMLGVAINESGWGNSSIALNKKNVFGHGAVDSNAGFAAYTYSSVSDSIAYHADTFMSKGYMDPKDSRYNGPHLGNKDSGANIKYASDPYWGEKAAAQAYLLEDYYSEKMYDYNKYQIATSSVKVEAYNTLGGKVIYTNISGAGKVVDNFPYIVLGTETYKGETWYKIQSDGVLKEDRSGVDASTGVYDFNRDYVYVKASLLTLANKVEESVKPQEPVEPEEPVEPQEPAEPEEYVLGDPSGDGKITSLDYMMIKNYIMGLTSITGKNLLAADVSKDGKITSLDYMMIKNHIMGTYTIK